MKPICTLSDDSAECGGEIALFKPYYKEPTMKRISLLIAVLVLLGLSQVALADSITDLYDFSGSGTDSGRTYLDLCGGPSASGCVDPRNDNSWTFNYTHNLVFTPPAESITSATITLSHKENNTQNPNNELWIMYSGTATKLGNLDFSNSDWVDQVFPVPASLYPSLPTGLWSLNITLSEETNGADDLWIDKSVLSVDYVPDPPPAPVPEPTTLLLLGTGLVGVWIFRKR
jgi:PEP-CTERM motif